MTRLLGSLRIRLAVLGFLAIYLPALLLFGVVLVTEVETVETSVVDGRNTTSESTHRSPALTWTIVGLAPAAAGLSWWWAARATAPIERVRATADEIGGTGGTGDTDLGRRIALARGPAEAMALAASFDAMLDRLERAAAAQWRLIDETSHELRVPLSVLMANAEVLLAHPDPTVEVYREGLVRSLTAAERLRTTLDQLLTDARTRARAVERRPADLVALARDVTEQAGVLAARKGITVTVAGPDDAVCSVDEPTVSRALANLLDNAIRYAPGGSGVEITVAVDGGTAEVVVTDHGPGIPVAEREHVFERFWRGRRDVPGTGLGLPIARQVALAHGGDLTLSAPEGGGCAFRLTLRR
ncbi:HAMP domain-containing sensor histidine kinase [Spongiactinospora sp. TRM90649]|uniref:sensor histidine kinase n=1 Tax=Spongiactinospora sp. TRM90649 TaxID=3031114 RepID=UPI0023F69463|nr:HAMP domain-containing sensor histidine kinase [Spongiactinospora sp. TRM90649]MDF5758981.1 HAMP domain-containing sensor histidine kinase [Spongiactinospora sp. TRM90649]